MFVYKYQAYQCIERGKTEGVFKNCVHLAVGGGWSPFCKVDMLMPFRQGGYQGRCPEDCSLFQDKEATEKAEKSAKRRAALKSALRTIFVSPFIWFAKLPAITQGLILFFLIALVFPQFAKSFLEIIRALK